MKSLKMKKIIAIVGMPRSGTSFLGQLFDSHPNVAFRMEPLFAYRLKNIVDENSSREEYIDFFNRAYDASDDEFMNQMDKREKGVYPIFQKEHQDILVIKTTRFHEILPILLHHFNSSELSIISVVRHPCGAIHSWLQHPKEFPQHLDKMDHWRSGACRKTAKEEYWGFDDWKTVTKLHLSLEKRYENFRVFRYEDIVAHLEKMSDNLFAFAGLEKTAQVRQFISECQTRDDEDPYSVYKDKAVVTKWKGKLDETIAQTIINECLESTDLSVFL